MDEITFHTRLLRAGTILDVGAHDGLLALPFSRLPGCRLLAFEPLPSAFDRLEAAFRAANGEIPPHVTLYRQALGEAAGRLALSVPVLDGVVQEQWASTAKDYAAHASVTVQQHAVTVIPIDQLNLADLTHAKLDAEGFEYEVLAGARQTLSRCRPVLSLELEERHRLGSTWAVPAFLDGLGYEVRYWHAGEFHPMASLDRASMQVASPDPADFSASDPYIFTFYAWPREDAAWALAKLAG
jgi:FkbM family methyltransferase